MATAVAYTTAHITYRSSGRLEAEHVNQF